jgi:hypothetical protein
MIRRSARINNKRLDICSDVDIIRNMINIVTTETCIKKKIKTVLQMIDYIIFHFDKIKQIYNKTDGSFIHFVKVVYEKIEEFIESGEKYLQEGVKIKTSINRLRYYQCIYSKKYFEYIERYPFENREKILSTFITKKKKTADYNCEEMKKHIKKFLINQLPLCQDVIEIIKSYCFYDKKTSETIKMVKSIKQHIVKLFDFAEHSRKNGFGRHYENDDDSDEVEHWSFCFNEHENMFQANNCKFCGNYWPEYSMSWVPDNILCNC